MKRTLFYCILENGDGAETKKERRRELQREMEKGGCVVKRFGVWFNSSTVYLGK